MAKKKNKPINTSVRSYDVIIAGGGPSGLTVASELSGSGLKVLLIEKGNVRKPANLWVTWTHQAIKEGLAPAITNKCTKNTFACLGFSRTVNTEMAMLDEKKVARLLLKNTKHVTILNNCALTSYKHLSKRWSDGILVKTDKAEFHTKLLVDCTSSTGPIAMQDSRRQKNLVLRIVFKKYKDFKFPTLQRDTAIVFDMPFDAEFKPFFFACMDKNKTGMICLNYIVPKDTEISRNTIDDHISRYMKHHKITGKEVSESTGDEELFNFQKTYRDNVILVGGAAGQADPKAAFALITTIRLARIAASKVKEAFVKQRFDKHFLRSYQHSWMSKVKPQFLFGRIHVLFFFRASTHKLAENLRFLWRKHQEGIFDDQLILKVQDVETEMDAIFTYIRMMKERSGILEPLGMFTIKDWLSIIRCYVPLYLMYFKYLLKIS